MSDLLRVFDFVVNVTVSGTVMLVTPLWGPLVVYARLSRHVAKPPTGSFKYSLSDCVCLFVYIAIANTVTPMVQDQYYFWPTFCALLPILANVLAVLAWMRAIQLAGRWNAAATSTRVLAILVFAPISAVAVAQIVKSIEMLLSGLGSMPYRIEGLAQFITGPITIIAFGMLVFASTTIYLLRLGLQFTLPDEAEPSDARESPS